MLYHAQAARSRRGSLRDGPQPERWRACRMLLPPMAAAALLDVPVMSQRKPARAARGCCTPAMRGP